MDMNEKDEEQIEEDLPSPSFGNRMGLFRSYSFGDIDEKL